MSDENNKCDYDDFEIFLAYVNDAEDQDITSQVLKSEQACEKLSDLQKDMQNIEHTIERYQCDEDYGAKVWNNIASQLNDRPKKTWLQRFVNVWQQPHFSTVSLLLMLVIATNFYFLGKNHGSNTAQLIDHNQNQTYQRLLAQNVSLYLAQTDVFLTQVSNMNDAKDQPLLVNAAESLLVSNRLYKNAFANADDKTLQSLLSELEKILIEVSNGHSPMNHNHIQTYTNSQLLFKVKSIKKQLDSQHKPSMSI